MSNDDESISRDQQTKQLIPRVTSDSFNLSPKPQSKEDSMIQNFRVSKKYMDITKANLATQNKKKLENGEKEESMTDVCHKMLDMVNHGKDYENLLKTNDEKSSMIKILREENNLLRCKTGLQRNIVIYKRVSVPFTLEIYSIIQDVYHKTKSRSIPQLLQNFISANIDKLKGWDNNDNNSKNIETQKALPPPPSSSPIS